jgi:hypothetical protein
MVDPRSSLRAKKLHILFVPCDLYGICQDCWPSYKFDRNLIIHRLCGVVGPVAR